MRVEMVQHPVGQGGLFSGTVTSGAGLFRWVHDCGSNQHDPLGREISAVAAGGEIDLLFLSHLDSDHVSGVDRLLTQVAVREVVLPYLDETALILILTREADRGTLSGLFVDAVSDLAGWFGSRGVETITFVSGLDDDDDGGEGPTPPGAPHGERR